MKGHSYLHRWGFSFREGATPFNFHMSWGKWYIFIYVFIAGKRIFGRLGL